MPLKCPNCKAVFRQDAGKGHSLTCPECKRVLRVPRDDGNSKDGRQWEVLETVTNTVYGPYLDAEMVEFVQSGRLVASSLVRHSAYTGGKWVELITVAFLSRLLPPPVESNDGPVETTEQPLPVLPVRRSARLASRDSRSAANFLVDFIDPTFRYYVTPTIISITWVVFLVFTVCTFVLLTVATIPGLERLFGNPKPVPPIGIRPDNPLDGKVGWIVLTAVRWVGTLLCVLWFRVLMETFIVVFHISTSLRSINNVAQKVSQQHY